MQKLKNYSPYQFSTFRIILGSYLMIHFTSLLPYASEIWSNIGLLPDPTSNLTYGVFPNLLYLIDTPIGVTLYVGVLTVLSFLFIIGFQRPIISFMLWYGWASLFDRNNLINNPGIPYIGWLLLCCVVIPKGEPLSFTKSKSEKTWKMPAIIFIAAWALMSIGYTISGFDKFQSPSWRDGSAIYHLLENPLARDWWLRDLLIKLPESVLKIKTWGILFIEIAFLPLVFFKITRKWIWMAMIGMHLGILMIVDFADLTLGMLMIHWFTFDSNWIKAKPKQTGIVYFDGVCGMCNSFIDLLITEDKNNTLQYAPLQGATAKKNISPSLLENLNTVIYQEDGKTYTKFNAVLRATSSIGGIWKLALIFKIIPNFIGDKIYQFIALNRYKWFGKRNACRIPTPEEKGKILI